jgi:hypothetical protein
VNNETLRKALRDWVLKPVALTLMLTAAIAVASFLGTWWAEFIASRPLEAAVEDGRLLVWVVTMFASGAAVVGGPIVGAYVCILGVRELANPSPGRAAPSTAPGETLEQPAGVASGIALPTKIAWPTKSEASQAHGYFPSPALLLATIAFAGFLVWVEGPGNGWVRAGLVLLVVGAGLTAINLVLARKGNRLQQLLEEPFKQVAPDREITRTLYYWHRDQIAITTRNQDGVIRQATLTYPAGGHAIFKWDKETTDG